MNIVITIEEKDIMENPNILDMAKSFAHSLRGKKAEPEKPIADAVKEEPAEPVKAEQETPEEQAPFDADPIAEEGAEVTVSIEELRAAIAKVSKKHGASVAKKILQDYGAESLSTLDTCHYAKALEKAKAVL